MMLTYKELKMGGLYVRIFKHEQDLIQSVQNLKSMGYQYDKGSKVAAKGGITVRFLLKNEVINEFIGIDPSRVDIDFLPSKEEKELMKSRCDEVYYLNMKL